MDFHDRRSGTLITIAENTNKVGNTRGYSIPPWYSGRGFQHDLVGKHGSKPTDTDSLIRHAHTRGDEPYASGEGISKRRVKTK